MLIHHYDLNANESLEVGCPVVFLVQCVNLRAGNPIELGRPQCLLSYGWPKTSQVHMVLSGFTDGNNWRLFTRRCSVQLAVTDSISLTVQRKTIVR